MIGGTRHFGRTLASVALLLTQLLLIGVVPYADASVEAAASTASVHIESDAAHGCAGHDHFACQLCRALSVPGVPTAGPTAGFLSVPDPTPELPSMSRWIAAGSSFLPVGSRAPPRA